MLTRSFWEFSAFAEIYSHFIWANSIYWKALKFFSWDPNIYLDYSYLDLSLGIFLDFWEFSGYFLCLKTFPTFSRFVLHWKLNSEKTYPICLGRARRPDLVRTGTATSPRGAHLGPAAGRRQSRLGAAAMQPWRAWQGSLESRAYKAERWAPLHALALPSLLHVPPPLPLVWAAVVGRHRCPIHCDGRHQSKPSTREASQCRATSGEQPPDTGVPPERRHL
jgi:hypothetical protein